MIRTEPPGARLYLNGEPVGSTPYLYSDTKIIGSCNSLRFEKQGYQDLYTEFCRDEQADIGAIIGGIFFFIPFLWTMKYKPTHSYIMKPMEVDPATPAPITPAVSTRPAPQPKSTRTEDLFDTSASKPARLRELKALLDEGILTQEEFEAEKKKVLNDEW